MMHRPQDLDSTSSLALLQEEASQDQPIKRSKLGSYSKINTQEPVKPAFMSVPSSVRAVEDRKMTNSSKNKQFGEDKLSALKKL
jgi:hypothetical protein